jgi:hypothetical protein
MRVLLFPYVYKSLLLSKDVLPYQKPGIQSKRRGAHIGQSAAFCFVMPFFTVIITFKQYTLALCNVFLNDMHNGNFFFMPFSIMLSTSFLNFFKVSAMMVLTRDHCIGTVAEEPTARNSNLFPVKAKGEVRLRSVLSSNNSGMLR